MKEEGARQMKNFILLLILIVISPLTSADIIEGPPPLPISTTIDKYGNQFNAPFLPETSSLEIKSEQELEPLQYNYWFDSGSGPGVLSYQYQNFYSDLLSPSYASGYMTSISYNWSGNFNGWSNVYVYLLIIDQNGNIAANANVTNSSSSTLSTPANTFPANYRVAFLYFIDRAPTLSIYNGPSFGTVSVSVQYQ